MRVRLEDHVEIGADKGANPMLRYDRLAGLWSHGRMNFRPFAAGGKTTRGFQSAEQWVLRADLGIARSEADDYVDDHHTLGPGRFEQGRCAAEQRLAVVGKAVDDQRLEIHDEQRRRFGVDRKFPSHFRAHRPHRKANPGREGCDNETSSR